MARQPAQPPEPTAEPAKAKPVTFDEGVLAKSAPQPTAKEVADEDARFSAKLKEVMDEFNAVGKPMDEGIFAEARRRMAQK